MTLAPLSLVVAVAKNGVIGRAGGLPWRFPEDLRHFKRVTTGHAILMGRTTFESIGKALPDRRNIVITRSKNLIAPGCEIAFSLDEAIAMARATDAEPCIIGGASIYKEALPLITTMHWTEIDESPEGDVYFPPFDRSQFKEVARRPGEDPHLSFITLKRLGT